MGGLLGITTAAPAPAPTAAPTTAPTLAPALTHAPALGGSLPPVVNAVLTVMLAGLSALAAYGLPQPHHLGQLLPRQAVSSERASWSRRKGHGGGQGQGGGSAGEVTVRGAGAGVPPWRRFGSIGGLVGGLTGGSVTVPSLPSVTVPSVTVPSVASALLITSWSSRWRASSLSGWRAEGWRACWPVSWRASRWQGWVMASHHHGGMLSSILQMVSGLVEMVNEKMANISVRLVTV